MDNSIGGWWRALCCNAFVVCVLLPSAAVGEQVDRQDFTALQTQLEQLGWRAERSPAGDLLLWPPGQQRGSPSAVFARQPDDDDDGLVPATDIETLKNKLAEKGWDVSEDVDGSLLLYRDQPSTITAPASQVSVAGVDGETDQFQEVQALLAASGWRIERDTQGDLTLFPQSSLPAAPRSKTVLQVASTDLNRVREALAASGWRLRESWDGSLILFPGAPAAEQEKVEQTVEQQVWFPQPGVQIELPVDSWQEARKIAEDWVEQQPRRDLTVGKIRKINWVYLVSIVENKKPFRLNNQLVIRNKDGRVVLLF